MLDGPPTKLAFRDATVNQMIPFIVEATGDTWTRTGLPEADDAIDTTDDTNASIER